MRVGARRMTLQAVEVTVPDGIVAGDDFLLQFEGLELSVTCPSGCSAGDAIQIEVDVAESANAQQQQQEQLEVTVPDGCFPGSTFSVEFGNSTFDVTVPEGCEPGSAIVIEVPAANGLPDDAESEQRTEQEEKDAELARRMQQPDGEQWACHVCTLLNDAHARMCAVCETDRPGTAGRSGGSGAAADDPEERARQEARDAELAKRLQNDEVRESANMDALGGTSSALPAFGGGSALGGGWSTQAPSSQPAPAQPTSLFAMPVGTDDGMFGRPAGEFHVGQLVQVTRSDGSWTYGKIMSYEDSGGTYSVMTRAGAKHFVERADITDDVVINPGDGGCAQQ